MVNVFGIISVSGTIVSIAAGFLLLAGAVFLSILSVLDRKPPRHRRKTGDVK